MATMTERMIMRVVRSTGIAALFLFFATIVPLYAQKDEQNEKQGKAEKHPDRQQQGPPPPGQHQQGQAQPQGQQRNPPQEPHGQPVQQPQTQRAQQTQQPQQAAPHQHQNSPQERHGQPVEQQQLQGAQRSQPPQQADQNKTRHRNGTDNPSNNRSSNELKRLHISNNNRTVPNSRP